MNGFVGVLPLRWLPLSCRPLLCLPLLWIACLLSACGLIAAGCRPADPTLVTIVSSLPRTGSAKQQSDTIVRGIRMAVEEVGGRVGPYRVEYLDLDDSTAAAGQWTTARGAQPVGGFRLGETLRAGAEMLQQGL